MADAETVVARIRKAALARGVCGIKSIGRMFKIYDDDGNRKLTKDELKYGLEDYGCALSEGELDCVFSAFDQDGNGAINYEEFLGRVRPPMSQYRKDLIGKVFDFMDKTGDGQIDVDDICNVYDVSKHPKYMSGEMTKKQVLDQFLNEFEPDPSMRDAKVTLEEFTNYYSGVSNSIDQDIYFQFMMTQAYPKAFDANYHKPKRGEQL